MHPAGTTTGLSETFHALSGSLQLPSPDGRKIARMALYPRRGAGDRTIPLRSHRGAPTAAYSRAMHLDTVGVETEWSSQFCARPRLLLLL